MDTDKLYALADLLRQYQDSVDTPEEAAAIAEARKIVRADLDDALRRAMVANEERRSRGGPIP